MEGHRRKQYQFRRFAKQRAASKTQQAHGVSIYVQEAKVSIESPKSTTSIGDGIKVRDEEMAGAVWANKVNEINDNLVSWARREIVNSTLPRDVRAQYRQGTIKQAYR